MSNLAPLTQVELEEFAKAWYKKLDVHDPLEEYKPLLTEDVELRFPEATVKGFAGYSDWYNKVINIFFDEVHTVKEVKIVDSSPEKTEIKVVVKWEASVWKPPAPNSERIVLDALQTWTVKRSPATQKPVVSIYIVDELKYYPGSATL
ncbi:nuclear transport factor 2 family protein [Okeanomitos corallinicola TIOX110]|uniref:Nuclear transport factor 2 family protein n=1 Tax=Okeanomitos corallinicola TIOX110 TaxID=3133117 RepID=A0ABZ2UWR9_9CYAN